MSSNNPLPLALMQYAAHHRDQRNITLHTICVPLVIFSITLLLSLLSSKWELWGLTACLVFLVGITVFYTHIAGMLGVMTSSMIVGLYLLSQILGQWIGVTTSLVLLFSGYMLHRLGHWYEGNYKLLSLRFSYFSAAPLFATLHLMKHTGIFKNLRSAVDAYAGPVYLRDMMNVKAINIESHAQAK